MAPAALPYWIVSRIIETLFWTGLAVLLAWWRPGWLPDPVEHRVDWLPWAVLGLALVADPYSVLVKYRLTRWEITDQVVFTRTGLLVRDWNVVPISRIQTVDTSRGVLERLFGLARLQVSTSSSAGGTTIPGLAEEHALQLAAELGERANLMRGDAT